MDGNFFGNYDDLAVLREGAKLTVALVESHQFRSFGAKLHTTPFLGCEGHRFRSDEYWECAIRRIGSSLQHQCGTCKMGPTTDPEAVVNPQLQVYGIRGLRVVDASIIPTIPASHTNKESKCSARSFSSSQLVSLSEITLEHIGDHCYMILRNRKCTLHDSKVPGRLFPVAPVSSKSANVNAV